MAPHVVADAIEVEEGGELVLHRREGVIGGDQGGR